MKSVVKEKEKPEFPCLMKSECNVVLFVKPSCGTVVHVYHLSYALGEYHTAWNMDNFKPYVGEVTLSNGD